MSTNAITPTGFWTAEQLQAFLNRSAAKSDEQARTGNLPRQQGRIGTMETTTAMLQAIRDEGMTLFNTLGRGAQIIHDEMLGLPIVVRGNSEAYRLDGGRFVAFLPAGGAAFDFDPATLTVSRDMALSGRWAG